MEQNKSIATRAGTDISHRKPDPRSTPGHHRRRRTPRRRRAEPGPPHAMYQEVLGAAALTVKATATAYQVWFMMSSYSE